ncbi:4-hydroxy-tetrahydrodipicolinate reductase [Helicobacter monodelphidis]|uniref:4-hydroxy-tetrahydrodipicolinate reductase n=1 Tax=Helicobacter sp. 15-1451 TaxID=2004995 RepID=UPI000DCCE682|nr:4-hydroxy-tetrahydrodipicolinate reductase [Helicobacter sp. 15-1451]RAX57781.1 4-hydroxy-tetrahydrodipicolinate reductase [Helicobacter sp. 15-1451]
MKKIGVFGASGRVGKILVDLLVDHKDATLSAVFVRKNLDFSMSPGALVTNDYQIFLDACDVVIDFSLPDATTTLLETAIDKHPKPIVIGTTGLLDYQNNLLQVASTKMPILYASNMSFGVAILHEVIRTVSKTLAEFDIEIVEMHHRYKKDAPSGTALALAQTCAEARNLSLENILYGREGNTGERSKDEIAVFAVRGGDIAGKHTVGFFNEGEYLEFTHTATNRATFAKGALRAAIWLSEQKIGYYSIQDALGL